VPYARENIFLNWRDFEMSLDLSHLATHSVSYIQTATNNNPERHYDVEVSYSNHCYTKRKENSEKRIFDAVRYRLSKELPQIICDLMNRECHCTGNANFFTFDIDSDRTYEVYFKVHKRFDRLFLHVQSAYIRDKDRIEQRPVRSKVRFQTILYNILHNKPIRKK